MCTFSWALFQQILNFPISRSCGVFIFCQFGSLVKNPSGNTTSVRKNLVGCQPPQNYCRVGNDLIDYSSLITECLEWLNTQFVSGRGVTSIWVPSPSSMLGPICLSSDTIRILSIIFAVLDQDEVTRLQILILSSLIIYPREMITLKLLHKCSQQDYL